MPLLLAAPAPDDDVPDAGAPRRRSATPDGTPPPGHPGCEPAAGAGGGDEDDAVAWLGRLDAAAQACRTADLALARVLVEVDRRQVWRDAGCASLAELGERHGLSAATTRLLLDLGRAAAQVPQLAADVEAGQVSVEAAGSVGVVLADPRLQRDDDDWIGWARSETTRALRRRVRQRVEDARTGGEPTVPVAVFVRRKTRDDFDRARQIASRKAARALSPGETFEAVVDHYLDDFDPDRVTPGRRRSSPTTEVRGRYVPVAVRREVYERQGQRCAVPFCEHALFLELAHLWPHASGGSREADNLVLLCTLHHLWMDQGQLRMEGTAARPRFYDPEGNDLSQRFHHHADPPRAGAGGQLGSRPTASPPPYDGTGGEPGRGEQPGAGRAPPPTAPSPPQGSSGPIEDPADPDVDGGLGGIHGDPFRRGPALGPSEDWVDDGRPDDPDVP